MRRLKFILSILVILISGSCSKIPTDNLYIPAASDATSTATLEDLQQGRTLYINNCGKCHSLYSPDAYTPTNWKSIVPNMARNTSLTSTQITLVTKYVTRGN